MFALRARIRLAAALVLTPRVPLYDGWSLFPCGMPACVTPRGTPHFPKWILVRVCTKCIFFRTLETLTLCILAACRALD